MIFYLIFKNGLGSFSREFLEIGCLYYNFKSNFVTTQSQRVVSTNGICRRRVRVFQCAKSLKVHIFSLDSHSLYQVHQKNIKNCHFEACFKLPHPLRSFMLYRMKRQILKKKFWLKNCTSNPPNDLNLQYIPLIWTKF